MDFGTIRRKLNTFDYNSYEECIDDIKLIFSNSQLYNVVSAIKCNLCCSVLKCDETLSTPKKQSNFIQSINKIYNPQ